VNSSKQESSRQSSTLSPQLSAFSSQPPALTLSPSRRPPALREDKLHRPTQSWNYSRVRENKLHRPHVHERELHRPTRGIGRCCRPIGGSRPGGATQLSPALQRWERARKITQVPEGRPAVAIVQSSANPAATAADGTGRYPMRDLCSACILPAVRRASPPAAPRTPRARESKGFLTTCD
jgi:hypothetical protein